ncbi:hypothetical protein [Rubripirellula amarantea]|nr:hypothetical protein [Rubripirellula amarantea]
MRTHQSVVFLFLVASISTSDHVNAHHPDRECQPVHERIDVIGPLGNNLPAGHRRRLNRPSYWEGKILYKIAPTSQEAMAWHRAEHKGYYECDAPRMETHYFYPKPYERMRIGSRDPQEPHNKHAVSRSVDVEPMEDSDLLEIDTELPGSDDDTPTEDMPVEDMPVEDIEVDEIENEYDSIRSLSEDEDSVSIFRSQRTLAEWIRQTGS